MKIFGKALLIGGGIVWLLAGQRRRAALGAPPRALHVPPENDIQATLLARENQLTVIYENIKDILYLIEVMDDGFYFVSVNPNFLTATGLPLNQVLGRRVEEVIPEPSLGIALGRFREAVETGKTVYWEEVSQYPAGTRYGEVMVAPVLDPTGRCKQLVGTVHDVTERRCSEENLFRLAHFDPLTSLPNRRSFYESLDRETEAARDQDWTVALLYLDLDRFKLVNDTFGHLMGDELLRQVASRILQCTRVRDTVGRLGGDEFGVVAIISSESNDAATLAGKLVEALQQPFLLAGREVVVTPSIGIALCPSDTRDPETLVKFADMAMYDAKAAGRNAYRFYTPSMNARMRDKLQLEAALRTALARREFVIHYQPRMNIDSGEWTGAEALLRWNRPGTGLVSPADFVPALEESGLIVPVGRWIIDSACQQMREWHDAGIGGITVSVNISARQVLPSGRRDHDYDHGHGQSGTHSILGGGSDHICEHVEDCLRRHRVDPGALALELTETALMSHAEKTVEILGQLKQLGVHILVDDFGTGYSSLAYLKRFPIDTLKIDREFISDLTTDPEDRAITRAIISLAHSLHLKIIAEGVETIEQLEFLREERCDQAQGYYFAHPMPGDELLKLFQSNGHGPGHAFDKRQASLFGRPGLRH